jgi:hypothetical protein
MKNVMCDRVTFMAGMPEYNFSGQELVDVQIITQAIHRVWDIDCGVYFGKGTWEGKIEDCVRFECILDNFTPLEQADIRYLCEQIRTELGQEAVLVATDRVSVSLYFHGD